MPRPIKSPLHYMADGNDKTFFISPSVPDKISDVMGLLKLGISIGPNSIPSNILKLLQPQISTLFSDKKLIYHIWHTPRKHEIS